MIKRLLIANRGEIAVRIMRAARNLGVQSVAVYSDADKNSMHVHLADDAVYIGESEPVHSYINEQKIIEAALKSGADSIHPGYGFLSEKSSFVEECSRAGINFVGPTKHAMDSLGSKIYAKQTAQKLHIPLTPGYFERNASPNDLLEAARKIGFPVMLKASAGGGGRGMRPVWEESDFLKLLELASTEAEKAFGDGAMMVEKYVPKSRHIEIQILADKYGNVHALHERECSLQRKHQKILEETPSPYILDNFHLNLREKLEECSIKLMKDVGYQNAGTVEFMVDDATGEFYFLEVNTRLQVEHPVTEELTGIDLVQHQLLVASNEEIKDLKFSPRNHIIEARITAEDPAKGFMPSIGKILGWALPEGPGVRVDTGFSAGQEISQFYDSMIAKLIVTGSCRMQAIEKLKIALKDFHVLGVNTNISYLLDLLSDPRVISGQFDTNYIERERPDWEEKLYIPEGLSALYHKVRLSDEPRVGSDTDQVSLSGTAWSQSDSWRNTHEDK